MAFLNMKFLIGVKKWTLFFSFFPSAFLFSEGLLTSLVHITYRFFVADITDLKKQFGESNKTADKDIADLKARVKELETKLGKMKK